MNTFVSRTCLALLLGAVACGKSKTSDDDAGPVDAGPSDAPATQPDGAADTSTPSEDTGPADPCEAACQAVADAEEECFGSMGKRSAAYRVPSGVDQALLSRLVGDGRWAFDARHRVLMVLDVSAERLGRVERTLAASPLPLYRSADGHELVAHGLVVASGPSAERMETIASRLGGKMLRPVVGLERTYVLEVAPEDTVDFAKRVAEQSGVRYAEPSWVRRYERRGPINDPLTMNQWHLVGGGTVSPLSNIGATQAWEISEGSPDSVVAIFDNGVDVSHPDLNAHLVDGLNVPSDIDSEIEAGCCWHGTSVAGVAVANANDIGLRGVCPSCSLMPIFDMGVSAGDDVATAELFTMACPTAHVINNSWGPQDGSPGVVGEELIDEGPIAAVIDDAFQTCETTGRGGRGTVIVFAAGNGNEDVAGDPLASHPLTINVASIGPDGRKSIYSDFGDTITVAAPSDGSTLDPAVWTTAIHGTGEVMSDYTDRFGGTSSAAPVVAGLVGLILSVNPMLTAAEVRQILMDTAVKVDPAGGRWDAEGHSVFYGYGMVHAYRALRAAEMACTPIGEEICNGLDEDCDAEVDEGCMALGQCEPCTDHGGCGADALCATLPNDVGAYCVERCGAMGACPSDTTCQGGYCVPDSGRCSGPATEVCNGVDDNVDGTIDESGCSPSPMGECGVDGHCNSGEVCSGGYCMPRCSTDEDCGGAACLPRATRYGEADSTASVCDFGGGSILDFCLMDFCSGFTPASVRNDLVMCVEERAGSDCFDVLQCPNEALGF